MWLMDPNTEHIILFYFLLYKLLNPRIYNRLEWHTSKANVTFLLSVWWHFICMFHIFFYLFISGLENVTNEQLLFEKWVIKRKNVTQWQPVLRFNPGKNIKISVLLKLCCHSKIYWLSLSDTILSSVCVILECFF